MLRILCLSLIFVAVALLALNSILEARTGKGAAAWLIVFLIGMITMIFCGGCASLPRGPMETKKVVDEHFKGRQDGLVERVTVKWKDTAFTRGWYFLEDPSATAISGSHTNMPELGGSSTVEIGAPSIKVDPQTGAIIGATGTAVGNVIGATIKTIAK